MPELAEVETTALGLKPLINQRIGKIIIFDTRLRQPIDKSAILSLEKSVIERVFRKAKYLIIQTNQGDAIIHLGMSGRLILQSRQSRTSNHQEVFNFQNPEAKHIAWALRTKDYHLFYQDPRRFGLLDFCLDYSLFFQNKNLGAEPLEKSFNGNFLFKRLKHRQASIKACIMNQQIVVGVGNIYANESLYGAGIHPQASACALSLEQCHKLAQTIKKVLKKAIQSAGTTLKDYRQINGEMGGFALQLKVYQQDGRPCNCCGSTIVKTTQHNRSSFFCSKCQPL